MTPEDFTARWRREAMTLLRLSNRRDEARAYCLLLITRGYPAWVDDCGTCWVVHPA